MADTIEIVQGTATVVEVAGPTGPQGPAGAAGATGAQGPQGVPGTGLEVLIAQGDLLYQGASTGQRLPIGTTGQVLKVSGGIPAWANESGAVSSVAGRTGAVTLASADISSEQVLEVSEAGDANCNGVFVYGGDYNGRPTFYKDKNTFVYWDNVWNISHNADDKYVGTNTSRPWQAVWGLGSATGNLPVVEQLNGQEYEKAVGQRTNPTGFGTASGKNVGTGANDVAAGNDARFTDARQPLLHASTHHTGGADAVAPDQIGAQSIFTNETLTLTGNTTLSAARAAIYTVASSGTITITLPTSGHKVGDIVVIRSSSLTGSLNVTWGAGGQSVALGTQYRFIATGTGQFNWALVAVDTHTHAASAITSGTLDIARIPTGTSSSTVCIGNDARLSDSRTPTAHAASHASGGSDPLFDQDLNTTDSVDFNAVTLNSLIVPNGLSGIDTPLNGLVRIVDELTTGSPAADFVANNNLTANRTYDLPDRSGELMIVGDAPTSHTHGNLTNDGKLGTTAGLPVVTTTAGAVTTLALGTAGQVLTVNSGANGVEFAAASGGGVTTGSVDNAILRADGTGGSTSQSSDINIEDATTSTQNNVTISNQHSGQTNSALVLAPKGNGPLLGQKPNGAASGGNSRGNYSTDLQRERTLNTRVASGNYSVICGGFNNSATNQYAVVGSGDGNQATGARSAIVTGDNNTASGERSFIGAGNGCTASGAYSAILSGNAAVADRASLHAHANGRFGGVNGSAQRIHGIYFGTTTTNSAVTIVNLSVPASKVIAAIINIVGVKSDGSASAHFVRRYSVKNSGGTTSEVYAAETIGTDVAASTSVTLSASDANDQLVVECTGIASEQWRWVASVDAVEVSWGT